MKVLESEVTSGSDLKSIATHVTSGQLQLCTYVAYYCCYFIAPLDLKSLTLNCIRGVPWYPTIGFSALALIL